MSTLREFREIDNQWEDLSDEDKKDIFLRKMIWYHSEKHVPGSPAPAINDLAEVIKKSTVSSESLSVAIKNATWAGAMIAGVGVFIAAAALVWDIYKTLNHI